MSIKFSGAISRSGGIAAAIAKQIRLVNLKAVKRVTVAFDPFDEKSSATRDFLFHLSSPKIGSTNANCVLKTDVVCNRGTPSVTFQLIPSIADTEKLKNVKIDSENFTLLELLQVTNQQISKRAPKEEPVSTLKTKSEKKSAAGAKRK